MKVRIEEKKYSEVDMVLPFYAFVQGDDDDDFVKITDESFTKITVHRHGAIDLFKTNHRSPNPIIASHWYEEKSDKATWDKAVLMAKNFVNNEL
jgi:hypothetical protein